MNYRTLTQLLCFLGFFLWPYSFADEWRPIPSKKAQKSIEVLDDYWEEDWEVVSKELQDLLDREELYFKRKIKDAKNEEHTLLVSTHREAEERLRALPENALQIYQSQQSVSSQKAFKEAEQKSQTGQVGAMAYLEVYRRFKFTPKGREAGLRAAKIDLDRGRTDIAAVLLDDLLKRNGKDIPKIERPHLLFLSMYASSVLGDPAKRRVRLEELAKVTRELLHSSDRREEVLLGEERARVLLYSSVAAGQLERTEERDKRMSELVHLLDEASRSRDKKDTWIEHWAFGDPTNVPNAPDWSKLGKRKIVSDDYALHLLDQFFRYPFSISEKNSEPRNGFWEENHDVITPAAEHEKAAHKLAEALGVGNLGKLTEVLEGVVKANPSDRKEAERLRKLSFVKTFGYGSGGTLSKPTCFWSGLKLSLAQIPADGDEIVTCSRDGKVRVYDSADGKLLKEINVVGKPNNVSLSFDGTQLFVEALKGDSDDLTTSYETERSIWDLREGKIVHSLKISEPRVLKSLFSPDGKKLYIQSSSEKIRVLSTADGKEVEVLRIPPQERGLELVSISPSGKRLVLANDSTAIVIDARLGTQLQSYNREKPWYAQEEPFILSPVGQRFAFITRRNHIADVERGGYFDSGGGLGGVRKAISPDGKWVLSTDSEVLHLANVLDTDSNENVRVDLEIHMPIPLADARFSFSSDSKSFVAYTPDGQICTWSRRERQLLLSPHRQKANNGSRAHQSD